MGVCSRAKVVAWFKHSENILMLSIAAGAVLALILAYPVRLSEPSPRTIELIRFPGDLFFNLMKLCILPVVICSILSGVTSMDLRTSGKLGGFTLALYLTTTLFASLVGVLLVNIIQPGKYAVKQSNPKLAVQKRVSPGDSMMDLLRNLLPENIVRATIEQITTETKNVTDPSRNGTHFIIKRTQTYTSGSNFVGIIFFCIFFGFILITFRERAKGLIRTIQLLNDISMCMMMVTMTLSPVGIFFLILATLVEFKNVGDVMTGMVMMTLTTISGLALLWLVVYPALYFIFVRKNPFIVTYKTLKATVYAFMLSSSSATLPLTFRCCEEKLGISKAVTRFMLPIGAIVNMDGTAVHQGAAALFIAQLNGINMSFGEMLLVCMMGAVASIACATTPGAGIVALLIVLTTAGLPVDDISLFFMTDWFLSRFRTATNVLGDSYACCIVESLCKKDLGLVDGPEKQDGNCVEDGPKYEGDNEGEAINDEKTVTMRLTKMA